MSKQCEFCGKKPQTGNYVSHSNIKTKRVFNPNLQNVRHQFANGEVRTVSVCTRCLRSGVVTKPVVRKAYWFPCLRHGFPKIPGCPQPGIFLLFEEQTLPQGHDTATTPPLAHTAGHIHPFAPPSSAQA